MSLWSGFLEDWRTRMGLWGRADSLPAWAQRLALVVLLAVAIGLRLASIDSPPLERAPWKEIDYLMISENYAKGGYRFLHPEVTWPAEGPRATAMELPLVPFAAAIGYAFAGQTPLSARWVTLVAFTLLGAVVFFLVRNELGPLAGLAAAAAALALPLPHEFGNVLFSEPAAICVGALALLLLDRWLRGEGASPWATVLVFGLAIALKVEMLYLGFCAAWLVWRRHRTDFPRYLPSVGLAVAILLVALPWYLWAYWLSRSSIDVFGVFGGTFGGHDKFQTATKLADPAWYREMGWRITWGVLSGKIGVALVLLGIAGVVAMRRGGVLLAWLASVLAYFAIVAEGQIDAPYRQLHAVPPLAGLAGLGAVALCAAAATALARVQALRPAASLASPRLVALVAVLLCAAIPVRRAAEIFDRDPDFSLPGNRWTVAQEVRRLAGEGAKIVTVGEYTIHKGGVDVSPVLYRYARATGWSFIGTAWTPADVAARRGKGAVLFVAMDLNQEPAVRSRVEALSAEYPIVFRDGDAMILDLRAAR